MRDYKTTHLLILARVLGLRSIHTNYKISEGKDYARFRSLKGIQSKWLGLSPSHSR